MGKLILIGMCILLLLLVGCSGLDLSRNKYCEEINKTGWEWENLAMNDKDFYCGGNRVSNNEGSENQIFIPYYKYMEWRLLKENLTNERCSK